MDSITEKLFELSDEKYRDFQSKLIPGIDSGSMIGVRTPQLKRLAKELTRQGLPEGFLSQLPHRYFDEYQLHAFVISGIKGYDQALSRVDELLPYVNNWATCDQLSPAAFRKEHDRLIWDIRRWISSDRVYTIRFGLRMLMCHFLDDDFREEYLELAAGVKSDEYYVNMMIAWFFATALAKQYDSAVRILESGVLEKWVHNKTIQKACESYRVPDERKTYLKMLRRSRID
ncbi:MAG: DNA alkylation repair protein [Ruminococcus sp.]|nr:DNA alkylation repair protein [Ruminococcus sp.]